MIIKLITFRKVKKPNNGVNYPFTTISENFVNIKQDVLFA